VLDFRPKSSKRPKNYLGRGEQRRLLMLVMLSGLMLLFLVQAAKPSTWQWMFGGQDPGGKTTAIDAPETRLSRPVDEPDVFIAQADIPAAEPESPGEKYFPGVRPDYLQTVKDDTVIQGRESDAWFHLLEVLDKSKQQDLERASLGKVDYVQLFRQPTAYRGKLVTLSGIVRRCEHVPAEQNSFGVGDYYRLTLEPPSPKSPIIIFCLHLPKDFPVGAQVDAECTLTGFSYKRLAYQSARGIETAPTVLARTVDWRPPVVLERVGPAPEDLIPWMIGGLILLALVCAVWYLRTRKHAPESWEDLPSPQQLAQPLGELQKLDLPPTLEDDLNKLGRL